MAPIIHGRIYPETWSSTLLRCQLRVLIDPRQLAGEAVRHIIDIDVLRQYLAGLPGPPCEVKVLVPSRTEPALAATYELLQGFGVEVLPYASIVVPEAAEALGAAGERYPEVTALVSTAVASDVDMVVTGEPPEGLDFDELSRKVFVAFGNWETAKKACEVFVRGHEVPWSFRLAMWGCPWTPFYVMAERDEKLVALYQRVSAGGIDAATVELVRSLTLNRHAALSYTRDKLLFYILQRRAAKRHKLERQDFAFETGYLLNHYYVLLWAGLDQICWVVNGLFDLGLAKKNWRSVGALNPNFLKILREKAPSVLKVFEDGDSVRWMKLLRGARHWVAHEGFAMPTTVFLVSGPEPSDQELNREIELSDEWRDMAAWPEFREQFRPTLRWKAKLRRYKQMAEPVIKVDIDGAEYLTYPLVNIEWDFDSFFTLAHRVADLAMEHLERKATAR